MKSVVKIGVYKLTLESRKRAKEIKELHAEITALLFQSLQRAIRIGELLTAEKAEQGYGGFTKWCKDNLPFSDRTARRYIEVYENKDTLLKEGIQDATEAYRLLKAARLPEEEVQTLDTVSKVETVKPSSEAASESIPINLASIKLTDREQQLIAKIVSMGGERQSAENGIKMQKWEAKQERERRQKEKEQRQKAVQTDTNFKQLDVPQSVYRRFSRLAKKTGRPIAELLEEAADTLAKNQRTK